MAKQDKSELRQTISDALERARLEELRCSARSFDRATGIPIGTAYMITKRAGNITLDNLHAIAQAFGLEHAGILIDRALAGAPLVENGAPIHDALVQELIDRYSKDEA